MTTCRVCNLELSQTESPHFCNTQEQNWCSNHQKSGIYFTSERIANQTQVQRYLDAFKCGLCTNLVRHPKACGKCQKLFCRDCIANSLIKNDRCPKCRIKSPSINTIPRNIQNLLNKIKIHCKNADAWCAEVREYDQLEKHESSCRQCQLCKVKCQSCPEYLLKDEVSNH